MDDDCDGVVDNGLESYMYYRDADNDTYGNMAITTVACEAPDGYVDNSTGFDCNDNDSEENPGMTEVCGNGIDDNCNGQTDEGCVTSTTTTAGGGGGGGGDTTTAMTTMQSTTTTTTPDTTTTPGTTTPRTTTTAWGVDCPVQKVLGEDNPDLESLRDFRDRILAQSALGRRIIEIYYNNAGNINEALDSNPALREIARKVLEMIAPMVGNK
jgi:hypothetical protein